jgi:hypothetical protein
MMTNCTLQNNTAVATGGGGAGCTMYNCAVLNNASSTGGGASGGTLNNCTLVGNTASVSGGGADSAVLNNCIVYYNSAVVGANYNAGTLNYCCATPLPPAGSGNLAAEPLFADAFHLSAASPCRSAGNAAFASGFDIDGSPWANPPAIGCDEFSAATAIGSLGITVKADYTNAAVGAPVNFSALIAGTATDDSWNFGDGAILNDRPYAIHAWTVPGNYVVTFRAFNNDYPSGVSASITVHVVNQPVHYVSVNNPNPVAPYTTWATAATNIQDAINAATVSGARVVVSNGVYATGGQIVFGALTNRVAVTKPLTIQSLNGPAVTVIQGNPQLDDTAVRCVYLTNGASMSGFTLMNGAARTAGDPSQEQSGAGIWCAAQSITVSNCIISGNSSLMNGAGAYAGIFNNCSFLCNTGNVWEYGISGEAAVYATLNGCVVASNRCEGVNASIAINTLITGNLARGAINSVLTNCTVSRNGSSGANNCTAEGCIFADNSDNGIVGSTANNCLMTNNFGSGANGSVLNQCSLIGNYTASGAGAISSLLNRCILKANHAWSEAGGAQGCNLTNCLLIGNVSDTESGAAYFCNMVNCTVVSNSAGVGPGGVYRGTNYNTIVCYNFVTNGGQAIEANFSNSTFYASCTTPLPAAGNSNFTNAPVFVNLSTGDLRLQSNSPCIDTGSSSYYANSTDLNGRPRPVGASVDIGAYEFQGAAMEPFISWLLQYGLRADSSVDYSDFDGDGMSNWQEWLTGSNPTDSSSVLSLLSPAIANPKGLNVSWRSVTNHTYFLQRAANLTDFTTIQSNIIGLVGTTSYIDTNAVGAGPFYYRVGVQ